MDRAACLSRPGASAGLAGRRLHLGEGVPFGDGLLARHLPGAAAADEAAAELLEVGGRPAEGARVLAPGEDDVVALDRDVEVVSLPDAEGFADLCGDDDPSEVVDL